MPVYFAHGFRWPRAGFTGIRVHTIFHNLEEASAEYIQNRGSQAAILASFRKAWPDVMRELVDDGDGDGGGSSAGGSHDRSSSGGGPNGGSRAKGLTLLEEYDPEDDSSENVVSRPWAFVCDCVRVLPTGKVKEDVVELGVGKGKEVGVEGKRRAAAAAAAGLGSVVKGPALSMNVTELIAQGPGSTPKAWEALADLRDKIAEGEKIDWWVIYNGDPERGYDDDSEFDEDEDEDEEDEDEDETEDEYAVTGEEVYQDQQPNTKTFVPQDEAILGQRNHHARSLAFQPPALQVRAPLMERPTTATPRTRGISPPPVPPAKERDREMGKRMPGMRAFPPPGKPMPPPPLTLAPVTKPVIKSEGGLKKKFFGKK